MTAVAQTQRFASALFFFERERRITLLVAEESVKESVLRPRRDPGKGERGVNARIEAFACKLGAFADSPA
jgi:hypothetical protein